MPELPSDFLLPVICARVFSSHLNELPKGRPVSAVFKEATLNLRSAYGVLPVPGLEIHFCSQVSARRQPTLSVLCMEQDFSETRTCPFPFGPRIRVRSVELSRYFEVQVSVLVSGVLYVSRVGDRPAETLGVSIFHPPVSVISRSRPCAVFTQTAP